MEQGICSFDDNKKKNDNDFLSITVTKMYINNAYINNSSTQIQIGRTCQKQ